MVRGERWKGWDDVREWRSYEGGLALGCSHDRLGHITMTVELNQGSGGFGWLARGDVQIDAGQLDEIALGVRALLGRA